MNWLVIGDEERLAVHSFAVGRYVRLRATFDQCRGGKMMGVSYVGVFGEVEQIVVVAKLDFRLTLAICLDDAGENPRVAYSKNTRGTDGAGEEVGMAGGSVLREDMSLCNGLGWCC